jgi:hypothetical protein
MNLIPNSNFKIRIKTQHVQNKNSTRFYCKNDIRTKQGYDKKTYPKHVLNRLKIIIGPSSICPLGDLTQRNLHGSFIFMCGPQLPMCSPCLPM